MGKAYTCDRCGNLFRNENRSDTVPVILENGNPFNVTFGNANTYILNLCPKCRSGFQRWWDEGAYFKTSEHQCAKTLYDAYEENKNG